MKSILAIIICLTLASAAVAQPGPRGGPEGRGGGPEGRGGPDGRGGGPEGRGGPDSDGPGMREGGPPRNPFMAQVEMMRSWLDLVDRYTKMSKDPTSAGIAAVISADDLMRGKPDQAIEYFTKLLPQVKNPAVERAIRLQLVELYGKAGKKDQALEQLQHLIIKAGDGTAQGQ